MRMAFLPVQELQSNSQKDLEKQREAFERQERDICNASTSAAAASASSSKAAATLPSFWVPNLTPDAAETKLKRPDKTITCPMSGKPLKVIYANQ